MITDENIRSLFNAKYYQSNEDVLNYGFTCFRQGALLAYPLIRQQVLKEVNDVLKQNDISDMGYGRVGLGFEKAQLIVRDMMEGGE